MANPPRTPIDTFDSFPSTPLSPRSENFDRIRKSANNRFQRRESIASIASSIGAPLDTSGQRRPGSISDNNQNAISTLLQPSITRTGLLPHTSAPASSLHRPPTTRDIPPVTLTNIPNIDPIVFRPYLSQVGSLFQARQQAEPEQSASQWSRRERAGSRDEDSAGYFDSSSPIDRASRPPSRGSISGATPIESPTLSRRRSSGSTRRTQLAVAPLTSIPNVYFDENFHLENPRTFDVVTERSEVIKTPQVQNEDGKGANGSANGAPVAPRKALATNAILQEKLSWYLDTVEIHLISSISAASKSFFAALGSLRELHSEAADSVAKIQKLRLDLEKLDKDMAMGRLEIVRSRQRRQNLQKLGDATIQLQNVIQGAATCEELVEQGDLEQSLHRIAVLEDYACGNAEPEIAQNHSWLCPKPPGDLVDMRRVKALAGFGDGMNQLRARIGAGYQSRFLEALLTDLRHHFESVSHNDTLRRWASTSQRARGGMHVATPSGLPAYLSANSELRSKLSAILIGLKRSKFTTLATATFREAINKEMKSIIRHNLPSSSDDDVESMTSISTRSSRAPLSQQEKSAILARNLRSLEPEDAEELLTNTYCAVGEALRRLQFQCKLLLDVSSDPGISSPVRSPIRRAHTTMSSLDATLSPPLPARSPSPNLQQELTDALDLSSLLGQAVDVAQSQIIKVLKVRAEQSAHLTTPHFVRYFNLNRLFADECEAVSGRSGAALKGVINNQIHEFIPFLADTERQSLATAMQADTWEVKDFHEADSVVLANVLQGMTSDPPSYLKQAYIWEEPSKEEASTTNGDTNGTVTRSATIDEQKFILPNSAILLVHGISRFETLIACIPSISAEVTSAILDYLKLYNSQAYQLVLGAGATRSSAGLKNINSKNLALASQALAFGITLIPYIREFVRRRPAMSGSDLLLDFDRTRNLFQDHQTNIHEKLVEIMTVRAGNHVTTMRSIDMDADAGREGNSPHMEVLAKETAQLYRALAKHLPDHTVAEIMGPVWQSYQEQFTQAFQEADIHTEEGRQRLLRDAEVFNTRLARIDGASAVGAALVNVVNEKTIG
ncbi:Vps54-domain-containing protein [Microthyrium microscopicum]|uniref:Vps54-domain-containing protein n=1 Tax=Microthyrium microscopicum TaxID=703497 RepID=A0A6A6UPD3_9PEZI|nr:Vps54-domain-containing protein [Microthyrium microscopicum]